MKLPIEPATRLVTWEAPRAEIRSGDGGGSYLIGYASVFDQWTTLYEDDSLLWREVVRRGAFAAAIAERQDVRSLFNHDRNFVLGRTTSGTLSLRETDRGLHQETLLADTQLVRDMVLTPIQRGDITGMSFGFTPRNKGTGQNTNESGDGKTVIKRGGERITIREENSRIVYERELLSADLFDVSPVTYPAYPGTSVGLRHEDVPALVAELRKHLTTLAPPVAEWTDEETMRLRLAEAG